MLVISLCRARRWIWLSMLLISALGGAVELLRALGQLPPHSAWAAFLSLSYEQNLPTFYAVVQLASCAALLASIAATTRADGGRFVWHWRILAVGFACMALDEMAELHERMGAWLSLDGALYFSWIVPAAALVLLIAVAYLPFLLALPARLRRRLLIAGAIYLLGALGMELPLGYWTSQHGSENAGYAFIDWLEECMELTGISLLLLSLLQHLAERGWGIQIEPGPRNTGAEPER